MFQNKKRKEMKKNKNKYSIDEITFHIYYAINNNLAPKNKQLQPFANWTENLLINKFDGRATTQENKRKKIFHRKEKEKKIKN